MAARGPAELPATEQENHGLPAGQAGVIVGGFREPI